MKILTVLLLCFVSVHAFRFLIGGDIAGPDARPANEGEAPFQISLVSASWSGERHICGGSLVAEKKVLTASHCCDGSTASSLKVKYGGLNRTNLATTNSVTKVTLHPKYNSQTNENDVCVLTLENSVIEGSNVKIIKLAETEPENVTPCQLTGWGKISGNTNTLPTMLLYAQMNSLRFKECNEKWKDVNPVVASMICSTNPRASGCNGDSGGPLVCNDKLVGVVSWGAKGCPVNTTVRPTVYGNVPNLLAWIKEQLK